ncbi:hypothetical protein [Candidatus Tokpelaia sp.]|uniref:hypothetical protein n=1 Tax=Candidatus Tokpelaia sp. TaxID=2233777 RepID=UPI001239479A|nr:hypothetical protein [Candidatus Tokpelaia sp.]
MVVYNFKEQFADLVASGEKCQTIRRLGKRSHARAGDRLQLYTGQRTKSCRKLGEAICTSVTPIKILIGYIPTSGAYIRDIIIYQADNPTGYGEPVGDNFAIARFAMADGFRAKPGRNAQGQMADFFCKKSRL